MTLGYQGTSPMIETFDYQARWRRNCRTKLYEDKKTPKQPQVAIHYRENGDLSGRITIVSEGSLIQSKAIEILRPTGKEAHYKRYWGTLII
jgi:hypothetical protein